jgi:hypothetical protein
MAAARRAYWKGYLKLSLVTCPIALYPASRQAEKTHFHQINRRTGRRHHPDPRQGEAARPDAAFLGRRESARGLHAEWPASAVPCSVRQQQAFLAGICRLPGHQRGGA